MNGGEVIDLSKPLSGSMTHSSEASNSNNKKLSRDICMTDTISTSCSSDIGRWEIIPSKYSKVADGSESAYETAPCSEESTLRTLARASSMNSNSSVYTSLKRNSSTRSSGPKSREPQLRVKRNEDRESHKSNRTSIRSLREAQLQLVQRRSTNDISQPSVKTPDDQVLRSSLGENGQNPSLKKLSLLYQQEPQSGELSSPSSRISNMYEPDGAKDAKPVIRRPLTKSQSAVLNSDTQNMDHVMELKKRFSDIKLRPVSTNSQSALRGKIIPTKNGKTYSKPTNHTVELKKRLSEVALKIDQLTDRADPSWEAVDGGYLKPNTRFS